MAPGGGLVVEGAGLEASVQDADEPGTADTWRQAPLTTWRNAVSSTICNITFDCAEPSALARFWGQVTGLPVIGEPQPGYPDSAVGDSRPRLYFIKVPEEKITKNRVHLDVMPSDRTQDEEIARLIRLGAAIVSDRRPDVGWVIMADPEGNEFCVEMSRAELGAALAAEGSE